MASQGFFDYGDNFGEQISGESGEKDTAFLNKFIRKADEKFIKTYERKQEGGMENSDFETEKYKKLKEKYGDEFSSKPRNNILVAQAGASFTNPVTENENKTPQPLSKIGSKEYEKEIEGYIKNFKDDWMYRRDYDVDTGAPIKNFEPDPYRTKYFGEKEMRELYPNIREFNYERNPLNYEPGVPFGKKETEDRGNILQRIAGSIFDAATFTQPVSAQPTMSTFSETGDPSFRAYRMGQDFADSIRGIGNLPSDYKATEEAAFRAAEKFRDTVSGMSNLPSDYKATEAAAFKGAKNFRKQVAEDKRIQRIIDRNPRLTRGADGSVKAVQLTRAQAGPSARTAAGNRARVKANAKARAQAAAVKRRMKKNKKK